MSRIFLSHSSKNNAEAKALADWLAAEGFDDLFLDLEPQRGIAAGERWERALNQAAQRCEAVLFLVSKAWLESDWCLKEFNLAHRLNKRLFGVMIEDIPLASLPAILTGTWQLVPLISGRDHIMLRVVLPTTHDEVHVTFSQEGLTRLKIGLERAGLDPKFFAWPPEMDPARPPYRGLRPLEAEDAGIFFGREAATIGTLDRLRGLSDATSPRFLVILGASGAGKSSYLRAGVLPKLARDDRHFLPLPVVRPERAAISGESGFLRALEKAFAGQGNAAARADLRAAIAGGAASLRLLLAKLVDKALEPLLVDDPKAKPPVLVLSIDQGEELFHSEGAQEGQALLTMLAELLTEGSPAMIAIVAIRSDSYERLQTAKPLEEVEQRTISLPPMPRSSYKEVIEGPAKRLETTNRQLSIDPSLTQALLADIESGGGSDALPLLAFTLERLYLEFGARGRLTLADYERLGGIKGSIEAAVERALKAADGDPRIPADRSARLTLLRRGLIPWLAGIDPETGSPRRRVAHKSEIPEEARPLVDLLVEQRLLSTDVAKGEVTIEPAHEALLRQWALLQGWLHEDTTALSILESIKRAVRDWGANAKSEAWLAHHGERLREAQELDARPDIAARLDTTDRAYLVACLALEQAARAEAEQRHKEREEEQARRLADARKRARSNAIGLAITVPLALLAAGFWYFAQSQKVIAEQKTEEADRQRDAAQSAATHERTAKDEAVRTRNAALLNQSQYLANLAEQQRTAQDEVTAALLALEALPDASSTYENARSRPFWINAEGPLNRALQSRRETKVFHVKDGIGEALGFCPDGSAIFVYSKDDFVFIWDVSSETLKHKLAIKDGFRVAISSDCNKLATGSSNGDIIIWDISNSTKLQEFALDKLIHFVAFNPDGSKIIATDLRVIKIWDTATGKELFRIDAEEHSHFVGAAINSAGDQLLTWGTDFRLINLQTHSEEFALDVGKGASNLWDWKGIFSPDGARIAVFGGGENTVKIIDLMTKKRIATLRGHSDPINSAVFSQNGKGLLTGSGDKTVRLWFADNGEELAQFRGFEGTVNDLVIDSGNTSFATRSYDGTVRLWHAAIGANQNQFYFESTRVNGVAISPNQSYIVVGLNDGTARMLDLRTGEEVRVFKGHKGSIVAVDLSHDGSHLATASGDNTIIIWKMESGEAVRVLKGHSDAVRSVRFAKDDSKIVSGSDDKTIRIWDVQSGDELSRIDSPDKIFKIAVSADGSLIFSSNYGDNVRVWDAATGRERSHFGSFVSSFALTGNDRDVVTASWMGLEIWDISTTPEPAVKVGNPSESRGTVVASSADGRRIASADEKGNIKVWDANTLELEAEFSGHNKYVFALAFSSDSNMLVSGSTDNSARVWSIRTGQDLVDLAHETLPRCLTPRQRQEFFLPSTPPSWCHEMRKWPY